MSSALLGVEAVRACARYGAAYAAQARAGLDGLALLPLDDAVLERAADLDPPDVRSLGAVHLATALSLGEDLGVMVVYDGRLHEAAVAHGLAVRRPA